MNIQNKPDYKVFASEARGGEVTDFPNLERGWGETIDKTEKIPPMEWFNLVGKRADEWLLYLTQRGVAEWDSKVKYPQYAMCQSSGKFYIAIDENENKNPLNSQAVWINLAKYLGVDGKLDASKVVQATGQSETNVMSQKAVTDAIPKVPVNTALKQKNGWFKDAGTGIVYQWGTVDYDSIPGEKTITIDFNIPFNNESLNVSLTRKVMPSPTGFQNDIGILLISHTKNNFTVNLANFGEYTGGARGFSWFAIGY